MKRVANDPLRGQLGTVRVHYEVISEGGVTIEGQTRALRMSAEQYRRFEEFLQELYQGSPEIEAAADAAERKSR